MWNVTIPEPGGGRGTNPSLEEAKAGFKESWLKFKAEIGPERLASALVICRDGRVAKADIEFDWSTEPRHVPDWSKITMRSMGRYWPVSTPSGLI